MEHDVHSSTANVVLARQQISVHSHHVAGHHCVAMYNIHMYCMTLYSCCRTQRLL